MPLESPTKLALSISGGGHRAAAFGLGTGEWLTNGIVGDSVGIRVEVSARRDAG